MHGDHSLEAGGWRVRKLGHIRHYRKFQCDKVAEWLRRWTANPLGSARVSSNLILVEYFFPNFY